MVTIHRLSGGHRGLAPSVIDSFWLGSGPGDESFETLILDPPLHNYEAERVA